MLDIFSTSCCDQLTDQLTNGQTQKQWSPLRVTKKVKKNSYKKKRDFFLYPRYSIFEGDPDLLVLFVFFLKKFLSLTFLGDIFVTDSHTHRLTDSHTHRLTHSQTHRLTDSQTECSTYRAA